MTGIDLEDTDRRKNKKCLICNGDGNERDSEDAARIDKVELVGR